MSRRSLDTRDFDTDPGWLGPRFLRDFDHDDDPASRLHTARTARGGGTIPPWMRARLPDRLPAGARLLIIDDWRRPQPYQRRITAGVWVGRF